MRQLLVNSSRSLSDPFKYYGIRLVSLLDASTGTLEYWPREIPRGGLQAASMVTGAAES